MRQQSDERLARICCIKPEIEVEHYDLGMLLKGEKPLCKEVFPEFDSKDNIYNFLKILSKSCLKDTTIEELFKAGNFASLVLEMLESDEFSELDKESLKVTIGSSYWRY